MSKQQLEIHSENILPIIKKWLYSDHDIFVRELVSNACDAIQKVKILRDQGLVQAQDEEFRIDIKIDKAAKTITFSDTGIGMDADEVKKYIAQIAFSGAEDFVDKYKGGDERDQFIGHFGLGFYSAYMVAKKVEIDTLSYKEGAEPAFWSCDGSAEYILEKGTRTARGTTITLFVDQENEEYLEEREMKRILDHYCAFMPYPIYLGETLINRHDPLWIKAPNSCTTEDYLQFYRYLYPMEEDPLFWIHLNVDYPFHLKGVLYFPKLRRDADLSKQGVKLFCNRVFVSDNCKDIIPNYLMALRGVIDSPDIPLNVSRSSLQMDRTVRQLGSHISKKVSDNLSTLYKTDRNKFINTWQDVSVIVKLGILEDDKFYDRVKEFLIWRNADNNWTTVEEYLERAKTKDKVFYTRDDSHSTHLHAIYQEKGIEVLCMDHPIDAFVLQHIERKMPNVKFQRVDAGLDESLLDKEKEKSILDASGRSEAAKLADFVRGKLSDSQVEVEAKSLASEALPGVILIDEHQRRLRDYMLHMDPSEIKNQMMTKRTFVVNSNHPLISALPKLADKDPELAKEMVMEVYDLALLAQREMDPSSLNTFISRSQRLLEKLTTRLIEKL